MSPILPPKKDVALALLERASVFVHLDPRPSDVMVPTWLKKQPQLVLQVGLNMAVKIPDLEVHDDAVSCTLSFSRQPCLCHVPWHAVYALVGEDGRGMVWPEDIPPEVAAQTNPTASPRRNSLRAVDSKEASTEREEASGPDASSGSRHPSAHPSLLAIEGDKGVEPTAVAASADSHRDSHRSPSERPYLRLIK